MTVYENVHVLIQLLQIQFYVYCYIQDRHTESDIRSRRHLNDIGYIDAHLLCAFCFSSKSYQKWVSGRLHIPVSISNGSIPVLNCDIRERRRGDIHLIIYVSG